MSFSSVSLTLGMCVIWKMNGRYSSPYPQQWWNPARKELWRPPQQEFVSSCHPCLVQVRLLPWRVCLQSWFRGSILWVHYLRSLRFQPSTWEKAWKTRKGLWQRLDVVWDTSAPDSTGYNPIRGPNLTAREAGRCSLPVCPNWNWVNI